MVTSGEVSVERFQNQKQLSLGAEEVRDQGFACW
jgi:hypothetical protein